MNTHNDTVDLHALSSLDETGAIEVENFDEAILVENVNEVHNDGHPDNSARHESHSHIHSATDNVRERSAPPLDENDADFKIVDVNRLYNAPSVSASSDMKHVLQRTRTKSIERFFHENAGSKTASPTRGTPIEVSPSSSITSDVTSRHGVKGTVRSFRRTSPSTHKKKRDTDFLVRVGHDGVVEVGGVDDDIEECNDNDNDTYVDGIGEDESRDNRMWTCWEWLWKDCWISAKALLKRKSKEIQSDMETKASRYKAWSKLKTVYGERFILLLTDQATKNGFMEEWIKKLRKFNVYYKQFSFGSRKKKVIALIMEVPDNTLELAAEAMKLQKQVAPRFGSIWIPFTQTNRSVFVKDDKLDNDIVKRMSDSTESALINEIRSNIENELSRTVSLASEDSISESSLPKEQDQVFDVSRQSSTSSMCINSLLEELERESSVVSRRNASRSFCESHAPSVGTTSSAEKVSKTNEKKAQKCTRSKTLFNNFPVFSSAEIQYITHWMIAHHDWLGLDINSETLKGNIVRNGCFPLHNEGMRIKLKELISQNIFWPIFNFFKDSSRSNLNIVEDIRFYLGDDAAWFYAFSDFLSQTFLHLILYGVLCLFLIFVIGSHVQQIQYTLYALIMSISVQFTIKRWKRLRARLRLRWGVGDSLIFFSDSDENIKYKLRNGDGDLTFVQSPVTGEKFPVYPIWKRKTKQLVSFFVLFIFNLGLLVGIYWIFKMQQPFSLKALRKDNLSSVITTQLPTALGYGLIIPVLVVVYDVLARSFSEWENYRTKVDESNSFVVKRFPFQFFVYYSAVLITAFSAVDTETYKVDDDEFEDTRSSLMIQVATFMCVHVLLMYTLFVILHKLSARTKLFNFKFVIQNGTPQAIQERVAKASRLLCCLPVRKNKCRRSSMDNGESDAGKVSFDAKIRRSSLSGGEPGEDESSEYIASLSLAHPLSMLQFIDCKVRHCYYNVRRFCYICYYMVSNDKDNDEKQLYFGKAEALLRRMRKLSGGLTEAEPVHDDHEMTRVMRSISSVIVPAIKGAGNGSGASIDQSKGNGYISSPLKPRAEESSVDESRIRQIQIRWRLKKSKRLLEKISAEKILGEIAMNQFNLDEEYGELMMVSGFVWILAAVFPLAPLLACCSCYVIIRGCTTKLLVSSRRPWPQKRYDIGSWLTVLEVISALAIFCNSAYMIVFEVLMFANDFDVTTKFLIGVGIEHGLILLKFFISMAISDIPIDVALEFRRQKNVRQQKIGNNFSNTTSQLDEVYEDRDDLDDKYFINNLS